MTRDQKNTINLGWKEWCAVGTLLLAIIGGAWRLSAQNESRFMRLETRVEFLIEQIKEIKQQRGGRQVYSTSSSEK